MLPQEISEIRGKTDDSAIFTQLLQSDPEFKAKVERVQTANPNMTPFEKMKFPSAMIDIHLGKRPRTNSKLDQTTSMLNQNMREDDQPSALGTLVKDPLVFAGQTLANVPRSAMNLVGGVAQAVAHPLQTGKNLVQLGVGGVANTLESIADLAGVKNAEQIFDLGSEEVASAVGDFYAQRYGGIENAAKTLRDDPVGFLSDLGAVVSGVGGVIKGGASLAQAGARVATTGMSPVSLTSTAAKVGRVASQAQNVGSTLVKTGINMEPLVIAGKGTVYAGGKIRSAVQDAFGAERQMSTALKLHPTMNEKFARSTMSGGETPAMYAIRKGVSGGSRAEIAEKFQNIADVSRRHVDDTLARFRQTYDVADEVPRVRDVLQKILDKYEASPTGNEAVISHVKALMRRERMSLTDINGVKRMIDDAFDLYKREPTEVERAAIEGMENMRWELQSFIEDQAKLKGFDDIGIFNKDTQLSTFMAKAIERADMSKYGNNILSLTDSIIASALAGGGLAVGSGGLGFFTAAGVLLTRKILGSVRFKTTFAKYISRITPGQRRALEIASKTGRHTKESRLILRRVVAQTAEDIKNNRIGEMEAASAPPIETIQPSPKSQASQVDDMARLTPEEKATGLIGGSDYVDDVTKVGQSAKVSKKSIAEIRANKSLDVKMNYGDRGGVMTRREFVDKAIEDGATLVEKTYPDYAKTEKLKSELQALKMKATANEAYNRKYFPRMYEIQDILDNGGAKKVEYRAEYPDGVMIDVTKYEYQYAQNKIGQPAKIMNNPQ